MRRAPLAGLFLLAALWAASAPAANFTITIRNSSTQSWTTGLLALQALLDIGPAPLPADPKYFGYVFAQANCQVSDAACTTPGCNDTGNAAVLAARLGLTVGVNAWIVPALAAGASATVTISATSPQKLYYLAQVSGSTDDFVAMTTGAPVTDLGIPLFDAGGAPLQSVSFQINGYDSAGQSPTDGNAGAVCSAVCPPSSGCYVSPGNGTTGGTLPAPAPAPVALPAALSGNGTVKLNWTNAAPHSGALVLRRVGNPVSATPANGTTYTVGQTIGPANQGNTVRYVDSGASAAQTFTDSGLANGTRYYYKVFAYNSAHTYATGDLPSTTGVLAIPTSGVKPDPVWCYTFGLPSVMQPVLNPGSGVYLSSNTGAITANNADGSEIFRPVQLNAAVQGRFQNTSLEGKAGEYLLVGDQSGYAYAVNSSTGAVAWSRQVNTRIQAQPAVQLYRLSNPATFQAANPGRDLVFIASRNASATANTVVALSSVNGAVVWTYAPGNMDVVNGGMLVDRANDRLWVAGRSNGNTQPSVRVLSTLTGAPLAVYSIGDVDHPVAWGYGTGEVYITTVAGSIYAYNLATMAPVWNFAVGAQAYYGFPTSEGFIASLTAGSVRRFKVNTTTHAVTPVWATPPAVTGPTGIRIDYTTQKIYVGSSTGGLSQINIPDGAVDKTDAVNSTGIGTPHLDANLAVKRVYVPTLDGRLCSYDTPL